MNIQLLKKNTDIDQDMDVYRKNLFRHRFRNISIAVAAIVFAAFCIGGLWISMQNRTFETYEVMKSFERTDAMTTKYTEFQDYVLKYGKDGISCVDSNNQMVWSQTYNIQEPVVSVCQNSAALAEENGTEAMIFDRTGLQGTVKTRLPIRQISVSSQGVLAALLEDGDQMRLNLYNKKGEELVDAKFELPDTGYPLRMSLSSDATKLAVSFLQVKNGGISTCLAFYNFDSVGENQQDHMVAAKEISGVVIPEVRYMDASHCFAVGTDRLLLYEGKQIPELVEEIPVEKEIYSIFSSEDRIGLVSEGEETEYQLQVYDIQGNKVVDTGFDFEYSALKFSGKNILIYNDFECMMLNSSGKVFFTGTFEDSISNLYTLSGNNRFVVMHASRTDQIRLR